MHAYIWTHKFGVPQNISILVCHHMDKDKQRCTTHHYDAQIHKCIFAELNINYNTSYFFNGILNAITQCVCLPTYSSLYLLLSPSLE